MILVTITNAKDKLFWLLKIALLVILLGLLLPKLYSFLSAAGSLHRFAEEEPSLDEPMRVELLENEDSLDLIWTHIVESLK